MAQEDKMKTLEVYMPGTQVEVGPILGIVAQVCIQANYCVTYEIAWWAGLERKLMWVTAAEVCVGGAEGQPCAIGFHK